MDKELKDRIWMCAGDTFVLDDNLLNEVIRDCAYHKWQSCGCPNGRDQEFWLEAEFEIIQEIFK